MFDGIKSEPAVNHDFCLMRRNFHAKFGVIFFFGNGSDNFYFNGFCGSSCVANLAPELKPTLRIERRTQKLK